MSFEITIIETKQEKKIVGGEWVTLDTEEVAREQDFYSRSPEEPKTRIKEVRGYSPQIEKSVEVKREVLKQTVDTLDLSAVIKAINKL